MAATERVIIKLPTPRAQQGETHHTQDRAVDEIEKKVLWLKTKLKEGAIDGPSGVKTYREDIRQILFTEFRTPISDLEIGVVVRKAFPRHSRKGKYYFGIGALNAKYADKAGRIITTDNPKSLMTIQSDSESREPSPVMLKPVKKRAIQAWKETENGQAFAADQMIRDASSQGSIPVVSVAASDGLVRPPWQPMLVLPQHLHMAPRGMLFPTGHIPHGTIPIPHGAIPIPHGAIPIPHAVMATSEPNNNINRGLAPSRPRKRAGADIGGLPKAGYTADRAGKKLRKEGAMIALSSSHNGIIAERNNLAAMHVQPIILDFDVSLPKLPLSSSLTSASAPSDRGTPTESMEKGTSKSGELLSSAEERLEVVPVSPRPAEGVDSSQIKQEDRGDESPQVPTRTDSPGSKKTSEEPGLQSAESSSSDPFKKPNIEDYRTNVSAGRCFMCQNPIPPNASKDASPQESAILSICMKCKKVALSGAKSFKPVPKFPFACNPKLAPRTVYVPPPRKAFMPRPPPPKGPLKAVGIRLYPPRSRSSSSSSTTSSGTPIPSPSAPPRSPGQLSMPGSPAPSLPLGSPQPCSPALMMHSAPPSPKHASDAGLKMQSLSLPPSPSRIPQHPLSPVSGDSRDLDASRRHVSVMSLQVPSPYSSGPSTPGGRDSSSSERLSLPPGREQDDATIKALLQLGRGVERSPSEHSYDSTPVASPTSRAPDRDIVLQPYPTSSIPIPHSPISLPQLAMAGSQPHFVGQIPMIPPNAGVVMGPQGQLLPIIPSWAPMGVHTSDGMNVISAAGFPTMPLLIQPPVTRESSSPSATPDQLAAGMSRSRNLQDLAKANAGSTSDSYQYDISPLKHRKALKRYRASEGMTDSSPDRIGYRGDSLQEEKSKSKHSIVVVGTNCTGSSFVKLNDSKEASYHHKPASQEVPEVYGKPLSSFSCHCTGRKIVLFQCNDCDFVCNKEIEMEQHLASQRHVECRGKGSGQEAMSRHAIEADDRDDMTSQSSVETQSADTDTDAASPPPPTREPRELPWSRVPETNSQIPLPSWPNALHFPTRTSQASFIASSYGTCNLGTVTENTVPLDLSGRTFQPMPYLPGLSASSFLLKEHRKEGSGEEPSPLDLSGYSKSPIMSTGGGRMHPFLSNSKLGAQGSFAAKRTPLDLLSGQPASTSSGLILTSSSSKKSLQPPAPQTFFDLMRLHHMPIPSTAITASTITSSKSSQSPISPKIPNMRLLTGPPSLSVAKTHLENPSSPKPYPNIPSIVLSSSAPAPPKVSKLSPYPTTELTRPPPGVITSPVLTQPQSLNYQGGIISIRPTIPVPQMLVSSKTVPVLSPFPLPVPVLASASEMKSSPGREFTSMESLNVNVGSPHLQTGSPNRGSPSIRESPKARQRYGTLDSSRDYSSRRELSPLRSPHRSPHRSPQQVHIKIEPPDTPLEGDYYGQSDRELQWHEETEKQARLLEASLATGAQSPSAILVPVSGGGGIGRMSWGISSKSLQIRDNTYTNTTADLSRSQPMSPDGSPSRTSPGQDSNHGARVSSGMHRTNTPLRESFEGTCPTAKHYPDVSREPSGGPDSLHSSSPNAARHDATLDSCESRGDAAHLDIKPASPSALLIKLDK